MGVPAIFRRDDLAIYRMPSDIHQPLRRPRPDIPSSVCITDWTRTTFVSERLQTLLPSKNGSASARPARPLPARSAREFGRIQTCSRHQFQITADPPGQRESQMEIDRRNLLLATAGLALVKLVGPTFSPFRPVGLDEPAWHPLTRSLLDRARKASLVAGRTNRALIERLIHQEVDSTLR